MIDIKSNSPHKAVREEIETFLTEKGGEEWKYFSASILVHWQIMVKDFVPKYLHGLVLDDGCGHAPYLEVARQYSEKLILLDHQLCHPELDVCADVRKLPLPSEEFDCVLSFQVLEHVPNPFEAIGEISRVLKQGGILLLSVPHLSRLHELPHDYFRFTEQGLRELANIGGLEVLELVATGGLMVFLGHQISTVFLLGLWRIKPLRKLSLWFNKHLISRVVAWLDRYLGFSKLFPQGYALVARKK